MLEVSGPAAGLVALAFGPRPDAPAALPPSFAPPAQGTAVRSGAPRPTAASASHVSKPAPSGKGSNDRRPGSPLGPPGRTFFGAGTTSPAGGAASGLWAAMLVALLAYAAQEFRRHGHRCLLLAPVGFASPQQRPG
jgi:hypothetical protein